MRAFSHASPKDRELFYTLRTGALSSLAGAFDDNFWTSDVARAAQSHPAVWHAALAIAATYAGFHHSGLAFAKEAQRVHAMHHYGRAMHALIGLSGQHEFSYIDKEIVLLGNALLIGLCVLWQDEAAAMAHTKRGIAIFNTWRIWEVAENCKSESKGITNMRSLVFLFHRLEQRYIIGVDRTTKQVCQLQPLVHGASHNAFTSLSGVYAELIPLHMGIYNMDVPVGPGSKQKPSCLQSNVEYLVPFQRWKARFESFRASRKDQELDFESILLLEFWSTMTSTLLEGDRDVAVDDPNEAARQCDMWQPTFQKLVSITEKLCECAKLPKPTDLSNMLPFFCWTVYPCDMLLLFLKCSDGVLRRRVISLLRKWPLKGGLLDPKLSASIIEATMVLEEQNTLLDRASRPGCCSCRPNVFICGWHRVTHSNVTVVGPGAGEITLLTHYDLWGGVEEKSTVSKNFW
ncbi:hypothetical protein PWT90_08832 [Aphanocladium album]|nr:hypothetical protein PWT90_08832 [Aphanocladium album]